MNVRKQDRIQQKQGCRLLIINFYRLCLEVTRTRLSGAMAVVGVIRFKCLEISYMIECSIITLLFALIPQSSWVLVFQRNMKL